MRIALALLLTSLSVSAHAAPTTPKPANARLEVRMPATVVLGKPVAIELVNVDDHHHVAL